MQQLRLAPCGRLPCVVWLPCQSLGWWLTASDLPAQGWPSGMPGCSSWLPFTKSCQAPGATAQTTTTRTRSVRCVSDLVASNASCARDARHVLLLLQVARPLANGIAAGYLSYEELLSLVCRALLT